MYRASIIVTFALLTTLTSHAQMHRRPHRPAPPPSDHSHVQQLMNQNRALQETNMKLEFCVRGLSNKVISYGSANFAAAAAFAQGRYRDYDVSNAERQRLIEDIIQRCAPNPGFTGG